MAVLSGSHVLQPAGLLSREPRVTGTSGLHPGPQWSIVTFLITIPTPTQLSIWFRGPGCPG